MKPTKEMIDAFYSNVEVLSTGTIRGLDDGLAALAHLPVTVKALEWRIFCSRSLNRSAETPIGEYVIQKEDDLWMLYLPHKDIHSGKGYGAPDDAEKAAQVHFDTAIRSALADAPADTSEVAALREALERIAEASPRSTNSMSADEAFAWAHAVAEAALQHIAKGERG